MVLISDTSLLEKENLPSPRACAACARCMWTCSPPIPTCTPVLSAAVYRTRFMPSSPLLASLHDEQGRVSVDGFYDGVLPLSPEMREFVKQGFNEEQLRQDLGLEQLYGEEGYSFVERVGARPTLELNGVWGGFQGEGSKTVIPKEAHAKITCRLVADQDPQHVLDSIEAHLRAHVQPGATLQIKQIEKAFAFNTDPTNPILQKAADAYEKYTAYVPSSPKMAARFQSLRSFPACLARLP